MSEQIQNKSVFTQLQEYDRDSWVNAIKKDPNVSSFKLEEERHAIVEMKLTHGFATNVRICFNAVNENSVTPVVHDVSIQYSGLFNHVASYDYEEGRPSIEPKFTDDKEDIASVLEKFKNELNKSLIELVYFDHDSVTKEFDDYCPRFDSTMLKTSYRLGDKVNVIELKDENKGVLYTIDKDGQFTSIEVDVHCEVCDDDHDVLIELCNLGELSLERLSDEESIQYIFDRYVSTKGDFELTKIIVDGTERGFEYRLKELDERVPSSECVITFNKHTYHEWRYNLAWNAPRSADQVLRSNSIYRLNNAFNLLRLYLSQRGDYNAISYPQMPSLYVDQPYVSYIPQYANRPIELNVEIPQCIVNVSASFNEDDQLKLSFSVGDLNDLKPLDDYTDVDVTFDELNEYVYAVVEEVKTKLSFNSAPYVLNLANGRVSFGHVGEHGLSQSFTLENNTGDIFVNVRYNDGYTRRVVEVRQKNSFGDEVTISKTYPISETVVEFKETVVAGIVNELLKNKPAYSNTFDAVRVLFDDVSTPFNVNRDLRIQSYLNPKAFEPLYPVFAEIKERLEAITSKSYKVLGGYNNSNQHWFSFVNPASMDQVTELSFDLGLYDLNEDNGTEVANEINKILEVIKRHNSLTSIKEELANVKTD